MSELELWNELGNIYFKVCAYEEAIGAYEKAIEVDRRFGWSYSNLALVYAQKGSYAEAIPLYRKSIELLENDKDRAIAWNRLGNTYRQLNDYSNAMAAYQRAVELDADNVSFRNDWLEWGAAQAVASTPPGVLKKEVAAGMSGCSVPEPSLRSMEEAFDSTPLGGGISSGILSQDIEGSLLERAQKALGGGRSAEKVQKSSQDDEGYTSKPLAHGKVTEEKETSNECTTASRFAPVIEAQYNNRIFSNELKQEYSSPLSHADNITLKGMPSEYHNQSAVLLDELPQWKIERKKVSPITEQIAGDEEISRWRQYSPEETSEVTISHPEVQKSKHPEMYYENPEVIAQTPDEGQMIDSDEWVPTEEIENQTKETTPLPNGMTVDEINSITQEPHELPLKNSTHDKKIDVLERVRNIFRQSKSSEARHDGYAPYDLDRLGDVIVADKRLNTLPLQQMTKSMSINQSALRIMDTIVKSITFWIT